MRTHTEDKKFFPAILRTHNSNPYVSETHESFPSLEYDSIVAHFPSFPKKNGKCAKEETAARSFRPEIWRPSADGMKLAPSGRSDSHSVRALRAVKSHPCGAGLHSNGRGAAPVLDCWFSGGTDSHTLQNTSAHCAQTQMRRVRVKYAGADPHPSRGFTACPWKICVAASASPLFVLFVRRRCGGGRVLSSLLIWLEFLCRTLRVRPLCYCLSS